MADSTEVVIVFGAAVRPGGIPSGALQRRIAAALNYARNRSVIFLVSGGVGTYPPAEAEVMANLLREGGIPESAIIREDQSESTLASVVNCSAIVRNLIGVSRVMACSDAYHLPRCRWLLRLKGIHVGGIAAADGRSANPSLKWLWFHLREIPAIVADTVLILVWPQHR